jgi:hypothetical protein
MDRNKIVSNFVIGTFVTLYLLVSIISTIHVIDFFELSNPYWLAVTLAIGFEIGAAASLASLVILKKMNKTLVWALFITITLMQMQGNMYYAFINMDDFTSWAELFNLIEEEPIFQKRVLAAISGAILPLVALGFIKSLVDYIKPEDDNDDETPMASLFDEAKPKESNEEVEYYENLREDANMTEEEAKAERERLLAEIMQRDQELGLYDDWDNTVADGLEDEEYWEAKAEDREKFKDEEWDEDHAHDQVLNSMLDDMSDEELAEMFKDEESEGNNPTSVGEIVKPIVEEQEEKVQQIKKKVQDLKSEVTTKEDAVEILGLDIDEEDLSEEELYKRALDKKAKEDMKTFISKRSEDDKS